MTQSFFSFAIRNCFIYVLSLWFLFHLHFLAVFHLVVWSKTNLVLVLPSSTLYPIWFIGFCFQFHYQFLLLSTIYFSPSSIWQLEKWDILISAWILICGNSCANHAPFIIIEYVFGQLHWSVVIVCVKHLSLVNY